MENIDLSSVGRYLGSLPRRKKYECTCPVCKVTFYATTKRARYCSTKCASKHYYRTVLKKKRRQEQLARIFPYDPLFPS